MVWSYAGFEYRNASTVSLDPTLNRTYSYAMGRWLSPDPLGGDISNPQSLNRYAYVLNNPTTFTDPLGLQGHDPMEPCQSEYDCPPSSCLPDIDPFCMPPVACDPVLGCGPYPPPPGGGGGGGGGGTVSGNGQDTGGPVQPWPGGPVIYPCGVDPTGEPLPCPPSVDWSAIGAAGAITLPVVFYATTGAQAPQNAVPQQQVQSCVGYFFRQTWAHANFHTPGVAAPAGAFAGYAYSAYQWNNFLKWLPLKYSNAFRVNTIGRFTTSIGKGVWVGLLVTLDIAEAQALWDEYNAFEAGQCQ